MKEAKVRCRACGERVVTAFPLEGQCTKCGEMLAECGENEGFIEPPPKPPASSLPASSGVFFIRFALPVLIGLGVGAHALLQGKGCDEAGKNVAAQIVRAKQFIEGQRDDEAPRFAPLPMLADHFQPATAPSTQPNVAQLASNPAVNRAGTAPASSAEKMRFLTVQELIAHPPVQAALQRYKGKLFSQVTSDGFIYGGEMTGDDNAQKAVQWQLARYVDTGDETELNAGFEAIYNHFVLRK